MGRNWTIVFLVALLASGALGQETDPQRNRRLLEEVLRKQERLEESNRELMKSNRRLLESNEKLAKDNDGLRCRIDTLDHEQRRLRDQNEELQSSIEDGAILTDSDLEKAINALSLQDTEGVAARSDAKRVKLTGEFRYRTTGITGLEPSPGLPVDELEGYWTDARIRLGFEYEFTDDLAAYIELQGHWAFGDGTATEGSTQVGPLFNFGETSTPVVIYQAYIDIKSILGHEELSGRVGRQEVVKGRQLQFGNSEFFNGLSFDGFRVDWDSDAFTLTGMAFKLGSNDRDQNQLISVFTTHDNDEVYSLYATFRPVEKHEVDVYWIYINGHGGSDAFGSGTSTGSLGFPVGGAGLAYGDTSYYHTLGLRVGGVFDVAAGLDYDLEFAFQTGDVNGSPFGVNDVSGWVFTALIGLTIDADSRFRPFLRFTMATGPDGDDSGYVPLFYSRVSNAPGTALEYLYGINALLPPANVISGQAGASVFLSPQWAVAAGVTAAWTEEKLVSGDSGLGVEIDLGVQHFYSPNLVFSLSFSAILPGDQYQGLLGIEDDTIFSITLQSRLRF